MAPVFTRVEDWDGHLTKLRAFWSSVMLIRPYHGQPMQAHFPLSIEPLHFDRWLALFEQATTDVCSPAAAAVFMEKARRIADSFEMAIAGRRGEIVGHGIRNPHQPCKGASHERELKSHPIIDGFIDVFGDWLKHRREVREMRNLDRRSFDAIARDLRITSTVLDAFVRRWPAWRRRTA